VDVTWSRYTDFDYCDLKYFGGLSDITTITSLDSLANNTVNLIQPPLTHINEFGETIEIVNLNQKWLEEKNYRLGRLKIYVNGKPIYTLENFEEVIPRALNTDKEKQLGVPFNISWGGGTQGLHENLTFSSCSGLTSGYTQDPESFPTSTLSGTTFSGLTTNVLLEKEFGWSGTSIDMDPQWDSLWEQQGRGGCGFCAGKKIHLEDAIALMMNAGLRPIEAFKNKSTSWKSECLRCGDIVSPKLEKIMIGQKGCNFI
jgi:hypothetical protein